MTFRRKGKPLHLAAVHRASFVFWVYVCVCFLVIRMHGEDVEVTQLVCINM